MIYAISAPIIGIIALIFAYYLSSKISKIDVGTSNMQEISKYIHKGSMAFLFREYRSLLVFIVVIFIILMKIIDMLTAYCFLCGVIFSILVGFISMNILAKANVRTVNSAKEYGISKAFDIAFSGGSAMGMCTCGLGLLGIGQIYLILLSMGYNLSESANLLMGFALGTSSITLFARVGGGIYTKATDVGADFVGKVEKGLPEDDLKNPAVIADNVADVSGKGSELFESYVGAIISAIILGAVYYGFKGAVYPLSLCACGIISSIIGTYFVKSDEKSNTTNALKIGIYVSTAITLVFAFILSKYLLTSLNPFYTVVVGVVIGVIIGQLTAIYTSLSSGASEKIVEQSKIGCSMMIISGLATGMASTILPIILISIGIIVSYMVCSVYGIALAAVGMITTTATIVAIDAYGAIADNACGIAQMCELDEKVKNITDKLYCSGNGATAIVKGFAISSSALTALALFLCYIQVTHIKVIDVTNPYIISGVLIGAMLPFLFSAMIIQSVEKTTFKMIEEVRRQFKYMPKIMEGTAKPDYLKCINISTKVALKEMMFPCFLAIIIPLIAGFFIGTIGLGGLLIGSLVSGVILAIMVTNTGQSWDNSKKYIESKNFSARVSESYKTEVAGYMVGDPFRDTSCPFINIFIKLMTIVSVVFAPIIIQYGGFLERLFK